MVKSGDHTLVGLMVQIVLEKAEGEKTLVQMGRWREKHGILGIKILRIFSIKIFFNV